MEKFTESSKHDIDYIITENVTSWDTKTTKTIVKSLSFLAEEIQEEIPFYDSIISDDISGRLPTLFFRKIINKKKLEQKQEPVKTYFITPKRGRFKEINENIDKFISDREMRKTLLVTEHIDSGYSLKPIVTSLKKNNIDFDIVSISRNSFILFNNLDKEIKEIGDKLKFYSKGSDGLLFHIKKLGAVEKDKKDRINIHPNSKILSNQERKAVNQARKDISFIAEIVYKNLQEKR